MTALRSLLRDDGAVVVPAASAGEVLRLLSRALVAEARDTGAKASPAARRLLTALHEAARAESSAIGTTAVPASTVETLTVEQASRVIGSSTRWVRKLAGCGRLQARRVGRTWLIDAASLDAYRHGRTAA